MAPKRSSEGTAAQQAQVPPIAVGGPATELPAPKPREEQQRLGISEMVSDIVSWFGMLQRSAAAHDSLTASLMSAQGQMPVGERVKGLPVFEFTASLGSQAIKCAVDLKKVDPQYIAHVLVPIINAQATDMLESAVEVQNKMTRLVDALKNLLKGSP